MARTTPQALSGVRVLDLSRLIPGPFGTLVLSDLGAQVDKVEPIGQGDYLRHFPPVRAGASVAFHALNRGKRSAYLDLKSPAGQEAFGRLVGAYDVLMDQFRPGVLDRLGLGHEQLLERHPELIVCALTGYGQTGPLRDRAGHDLNYLARSGVLGLQGPKGSPPQVPGFQMADVSGGMWCVIAILAALRRRDVSGHGEICDIAMTDGVLGFAAYSLTAALAGEPYERGGEALTGGLAPYQTYVSKDGVAMTLASLEPKFWLTFATATGLEPDGVALLVGEHQEGLKARLAEVFRSRTKDEWLAFAASHDCCVEPVVAPEDLASEAHHQARGLLTEGLVDGERVPYFRTPVTGRDEPIVPAPKAGEHTREILAEAGFDETEIEALFAAGAAA
ncbi:MAG: CoA transferase [Deltaproteobacteria bacterium]|nr:CoA transferase [Deltaproteobacteria bacterium]